MQLWLDILLSYDTITNNIQDSRHVNILSKRHESTMNS